MKAAAGPHDLGPGKNYDETPSELKTQLNRDSDNECDSSGDSTTGYFSLPTGHYPNLELYHHISSVWRVPPPVAGSDFFVQEGRDVFDDIAEYVFQVRSTDPFISP